MAYHGNERTFEWWQPHNLNSNETFITSCKTTIFRWEQVSRQESQTETRYINLADSVLTIGITKSWDKAKKKTLIWKQWNKHKTIGLSAEFRQNEWRKGRYYHFMVTNPIDALEIIKRFQKFDSNVQTDFNCDFPTKFVPCAFSISENLFNFTIETLKPAMTNRLKLNGQRSSFESRYSTPIHRYAH
jgi:hypothetical protein